MSDPNNGGTTPGENAPQPPAYDQPAPTYGQPAPTYGQPATPAYGQPTQDPVGYAAPPAYGAPAYTAAPVYGGYATPRKTNTLAVVSLISSIVGIFLLPFVGSVVGIITGHMSLSQIKRTGEGGRGLGLAGTIVGWVGLALAILGTILAIIWLGWLFQNMQDYRSI